MILCIAFRTIVLVENSIRLVFTKFLEADLVCVFCCFMFWKLYEVGNSVIFVDEKVLDFIL